MHDIYKTGKDIAGSDPVNVCFPYGVKGNPINRLQEKQLAGEY